MSSAKHRAHRFKVLTIKPIPSSSKRMLRQERQG